MQRIRDGFAGQKMIVLPRNIIAQISNNPFLNALYVTDIGFFPTAKYHYVNRKEGSPQNILIYCVEGEGWYDLHYKYKIKKVKSNQFIIIPANIPHRYGANEKSPWSIYWVHFIGTKAEYFVEPEEKYPADLQHIEDRIRLHDEMYQILETGYNIKNIGYVSMCLWHFLGTFIFPSQFKQIRDCEDLDCIEQSIQYMKNNLENSLTLIDIASQVSLSCSHFSAMFKRKTGYSPIDYFIRLRIQHACQLLDLTRMRIKEVSAQLGFDDPYYFSRVFRKIMGESPLVYRERQKG